VRALHEGGQRTEVQRRLASLGFQHPSRRDVWEAMAAMSSDPAWVAHAAARARRLAPALDAAAVSPSVVAPRTHNAARGWKDVDGALARGALDEARAEMTRSRHDPRWLAARAIFIGRPELAAREASLRLAANPREADARVALLLAADLVRDATLFARALNVAPETEHEALTPVAAVLLDEVLSRREGRLEAPAAGLATMRRRLAAALSPSDDRASR
ncbi:MAG: hypothetical protein AAGN82_32050, partial [Myxococcota bacterium]